VRKDLYQTEEDWYKSFTSLFGTRWRQKTETNIEEANEAIEQLEELLKNTEDTSLQEKIHHDLDKLKYAISYYNWIMSFIKVVETGEIFKYIPKNE
jgi:DNA-binding transcriptional regulator GbsR (MarR family)